MNERLTTWLRDEGTCLPLPRMESYRTGKLSRLERHKVEQHLLACPLCSEVYELLLEIEDTHPIHTTARKMREEAGEPATAFRFPDIPVAGIARVLGGVLLAAGLLFLLYLIPWSSLWEESTPPAKTESPLPVTSSEPPAATDTLAADADTLQAQTTDAEERLPVQPETRAPMPREPVSDADEMDVERSPAEREERSVVMMQDDDAFAESAGDTSFSPAVLPGGQVRLRRLLQEALAGSGALPDTAHTFVITATVNTNGHTVNPHIVQGLSEAADEEVLRVLRGVRNWQPAREGAYPVVIDTTFHIRIEP